MMSFANWALLYITLMAKMWPLLAVVLATVPPPGDTLASYSEAGRCEVCDCTLNVERNEITADCSDRNLDAFPADDLPFNVSIVLLSGNHLVTMDTNGTFPWLHSLLGVHSGLTPLHAFDGLPSLLNLELQINNHTLTKELFPSSSELRFLTLTLPYVTNLPGNLFDVVRESLVRLNLSAPALTHIDGSIFTNMAALESLTLGGLSMDTVPDILFSGNLDTDCRYLTEYQCSLAKAALMNSKLRRIEVSGVRRLRGRLFHFLRGLRSLVLRGVLTLSDDLFTQNPDLLDLEITDSNLGRVDDVLFSPLANLSELRLTNAGLESIGINASHLRQLRHLNVSGNNITSANFLPDTTWASLKTLNLDFNSIENISAIFQADLPSLELVSLAGNPLHCPCEQVLLAQRPRHFNITGAMCLSPDRFELESRIAIQNCSDPEPSSTDSTPDVEFFTTFAETGLVETSTEKPTTALEPSTGSPDAGRITEATTTPASSSNGAATTRTPPTARITSFIVTVTPWQPMPSSRPTTTLLPTRTPAGTQHPVTREPAWTRLTTTTDSLPPVSPVGGSAERRRTILLVCLFLIFVILACVAVYVVVLCRRVRRRRVGGRGEGQRNAIDRDCLVQDTYKPLDTQCDSPSCTPV